MLVSHDIVRRSIHTPRSGRSLVIHKYSATVEFLSSSLLRSWKAPGRDKPGVGFRNAHVVNGDMAHYDYPEPTPEGPYQILNQYHSKPRKLHVTYVGAGASGLCLAYKMEKVLEAGSWELTLFDKNPELGGTW